MHNLQPHTNSQPHTLFLDFLRSESRETNVPYRAIHPSAGGERKVTGTDFFKNGYFSCLLLQAKHIVQIPAIPSAATAVALETGDFREDV